MWHYFLEGFFWGMGFWSSIGTVLIIAAVFVVGLTGMSNIGKGLRAPKMPPVI
jgi:hypothetical protein